MFTKTILTQEDKDEMFQKYSFLQDIDINNTDINDIGYKLIYKLSHSLFWKDLILDMIKIKYPVNTEITAELLSEVYTSINVDSRFIFQKGHNWTIIPLLPAETKGVRKSSSKKKKDVDEEKNPEDAMEHRVFYKSKKKDEDEDDLITAKREK